LSRRGRPSPARFALGFIAGFIAVLIFHQGMLAFLHAMDLARNGPYAMQATGPLGVPRFLSLAFWGGVWGIVFVFAEHYFPRSAKYWLAAALFGALAPTLFSWFVLAPLRGTPVAGGWQIVNMWRGLVLNGAWGLGTAAALWLFAKTMRGRA
jgi:hypothetical protein